LARIDIYCVKVPNFSSLFCFFFVVIDQIGVLLLFLEYKRRRLFVVMEEKQILLSAALLLGLGLALGIWIDQIGILLEALSVGIGLCVGLAIWVFVGFVGDHVSNKVSSEDQTVMEELMKLVIDGKDSEVTFDKFPYYLRY
jgi:hypothetical protein